MADIYSRYEAVAGYWNMKYGPAHIVWEDENFERDHIQWCIDNADKYRRDEATDDEHAAVIASLHALLALPDDVRECEPLEYDGEHPENFPPSIETVQC